MGNKASPLSYHSCLVFRYSGGVNCIEMLNFENCCLSAGLTFIKQQLNVFWFQMREEFPKFSKVALNIVLLLCKTWLQQVAFSVLIVRIKILTNSEKHRRHSTYCSCKYSVLIKLCMLKIRKHNCLISIQFCFKSLING